MTRHITPLFAGLSVLVLLLALGAAAQAEVPEALLPLTQRSYQAKSLGGRAYVAATLGLRIVDVRRPDRPRLLGSLVLPGSVSDLAIEDTRAPGPAKAPRHGRRRPPPPPIYAYLAVGPHGVVIAEVTDPAAPRVVARVDTPGAANAVALDRHHLYVADGSFGVALYDVTDRALPKRIATVDTRCYARSVRLSGNTVYVACGPKGLLVFEGYRSGGARKAWPQPLYRYALAGDVRRVALGAGRTLYVAAGAAGVHVVDARRPEALKVVASFRVPDFAHGVSAWGALVAVAAGEGGVWLYDCRRRNRPRSLSSFRTTLTRSANEVELRGKSLMVAYDHAGLVLLGLGPGRALVLHGVFPEPKPPR